MTTLVQLVATTALIMGGTGMKALGDPHGWGPGTYLDQVNGTYLHLDPLVNALKWVPTPEHFWPATGLNDLTFDTSVARGVLSLNFDVLTTPGSKVVFGYSQSANIATREKRNLAELAAMGAAVPPADELSFVLVANPNRPNGGILSRFEGLYIPILGVSFDGATPNDGYATIDVAREYDLIADFPKYPLNLLADLNALFGYVYLHGNYGSSVVNLNDPTSYQSYTSGNTTYYLIHTEHLPLLQPLRDIGVPAPLLDLVEPTLRVLIDLAYDRTPANMAVPTRAQLIPHIDVVKLVSDLAAAVTEGVHNALADLGINTGPALHGPTLNKPAPEKPALDTLEQVAAVPSLTRLHLAGAQPAAERETTAPQTGPSPQVPDGKTETVSTTPKTPKSVRQSTLHSKLLDSARAQVSPRQRGRIQITNESDSAQPQTEASDTKDTDSQPNPRRISRAERPKAAAGHTTP
ncbi:PE-PPE domain-containing protein [Mycolicibacterium frederiksbergense]|nr:PE-PPE domain-containing protein [Mycolicibacterium frederiksbergense]